MTNRFALQFAAESYSVAGKKLMGRQAAGAGFMRAAARSGVDAIGCFAPRDDVAACKSTLAESGYAGTVGWIDPGHPEQLADYGCLYHPAPGINRLAWRRNQIGARAYSLCGVTHTTASHGVMSAITDLLVAPIKSWDAVICTSAVVRDSVRQLLESQAEYLQAKLGAQRFELPQLPLIPLGVHCDDFQFDAGQRAQARSALGIGDDDVAFLFLGRLSFHAKAHPQQMFAALEGAEKNGRRVHLILCGWFANEPIERAFLDAAALLCPSVNLIVVDGRKRDEQQRAWAGADVFTSLSDNVQETFGLTPAEAMAAGLPCVVTDWNGYRDTVRDGLDGYRIATAMPAAGNGMDLALRYEDGIDSYDMYCGHTSQAVACDGAQLRQAYERLIGDAGLRRQLGENARRHARENFDWSVIFARYLALWSELNERRRADPDLCPLPATIPDRPDPFAVFASYPTRMIDASTRLRLLPGADMATIEKYRQLAINRFAQGSLPGAEEYARMIGAFSTDAVAAADVLSRFPVRDHARILRGLAWLVKMDLITLC